MRYPDAFEGIKKIFLAQILALIGSGCSIIGSITASVGLVAGSTASGVGGGFFVLAGLVLSLLSTIFMLIGLSRASKDEDNFRKAFMLSIASLILAVVVIIASLSGIASAVLSSIFEIVTLILAILMMASIFKGIEVLALALGREDVAKKGQSVLTFLWVVYIVTIFCDLMGLLFPTSVGLVGIIGILALLASIAMIVGYILYLVHLSRAKDMLAAG